MADRAQEHLPGVDCRIFGRRIFDFVIFTRSHADRGGRIWTGRSIGDRQRGVVEEFRCAACDLGLRYRVHGIAMVDGLQGRLAK